MNERDKLKARITRLLDTAATEHEVPAETRDRLLTDLAAWQTQENPVYGRLTSAGMQPPAVPTDVFRFFRVAVHDAVADRRIFRSSGTTSAQKSTHAFHDLSLYDHAAQIAARAMLFPDVAQMQLVFLAPHERDAPESSLSYMLTRFSEWFGSASTWVWHGDRLDLDALAAALQAAARDCAPVALLGTSFAFVHAEDDLGDARFALPAGSRIMHTGGYKGHSREVAPARLRQQMSERYGVPDAWIIAEYGMTELSSQLYESTLRDAWRGKPSQRQLWVPPWVRATPIDPATQQPALAGQVGVLRIDDCANLDSACCIQTADLAMQTEGGLTVLGRASAATPRGCSLAADHALRKAAG